MAGTKQHLMTDGLIVREYPTVAESDRFVAILTRDKGLVRASARGARNVRSRFGAATQLLCYSDLSLIPGRDKYIIEDAKPKEVFFSLRQDMEKLALAQYFCELALHMTPTDASATDHLRLLLNGLHYLGEGTRDALLVKAVVEGRLLCLEGYMPDLGGCCHCGRAEDALMWFSCVDGTLTCSACAPPAEGMPVTAGVLAALRHILQGDFARAFAFKLPAADTVQLARLMERFLLAQQQRRYNTLEFYHTMHPELL
ncbi:MAG: DNA repair protein RecO [Clostridia bacterium]|nr:DNA repair protein RecO [Clostridia bacterium]